jgi:hypothetical protein
LVSVVVSVPPSLRSRVSFLEGRRHGSARPPLRGLVRMPREPGVDFSALRPVREQARVLDVRVRQGIASVPSRSPERLDGVALVRVPRARHEHGVAKHHLGHRAGQILGLLRVPAGVGQLGRLAGVRD